MRSNRCTCGARLAFTDCDGDDDDDDGGEFDADAAAKAAAASDADIKDDGGIDEELRSSSENDADSDRSLSPSLRRRAAEE